MTYIHYGHSAFDPSLFNPVKNCRFTYDLASAKTEEARRWMEEMNYQDKPEGGLWASRIGDHQGWEPWCRRNRFNVSDLKQYFRFDLRKDARVVSISTLDDIIALPLQKPWQPKDRSWMEQLNPGETPTQDQLEALYTQNPVFLDFEEMVRQSVDAVEIVDWGAVREAFPLWDCNSLFVLNAAAVM